MGLYIDVAWRYDQCFDVVGHEACRSGDTSTVCPSIFLLLWTIFSSNPNIPFITSPWLPQSKTP
jgi:hypothetical protein